MGVTATGSVRTGPPSLILSRPRVEIAYERWGRGARPLLLLHGFTGSRAAWDHLRPCLEERFGVIAVDLPGHGHTGLPASLGTAGFEETLDALSALVEKLGLGPVQVAGYSQGARVALGFAIRHRQRVRRLVLEGGSPGLRQRGRRAARRAEDEQLARGIERDGVEAFVRKWEALPLFEGLRSLPAPAQEALRARRLACRAEGLAGALRCLGLGVQPNYWPQLATLRVPTLLITGERDLKFTEIARQMVAELPLGWRCALPAGHAPHLEAPKRYIEELCAFLEPDDEFRTPTEEDA